MTTTMLLCGNLRDVRERMVDVETKTIDVLPLLSGDRRSNVIGNDLSLVIQMLNDEHDRCRGRTQTNRR